MRRLALLLVCGFAALGAASAEAEAGTVAGTVTPLEPAQEVEVCVVETGPSELCTAPHADGTYVLQGIPLEPVRIEFVPSFRSRLIKQYYDHKQVLSEATAVVLSQVNPSAIGIDADLVEGGSIEGTVTAGVGEPLAEVEVCAVSVGLPTVKSCSETDPSGDYELHSLPTGSYRVGFWGRGASAEYAPEYYDDKASPAQASPVAVTAGSVTANIDTTLALGAQIRGTVTAALGGAALEGIPVCVFQAAAAAAEACVETAAGGAYSLVGLREGSYQVGFDLGAAEIGGYGVSGTVGGFLPQYYDGVTTRAAAQILSLGPGQVLDDVSAALLAPPPPHPSPPVTPIASPLVAAAPPIAEPKPPAKRCKKGYRKKNVKGKVRCVRRKRSGRPGRNGKHRQRSAARLLL